MWQATLKENPNSFAANNNLGNRLMARGDYDKALALFRKASELAPHLDIPYFNQGRVYRMIGDQANAKKMYAKAMWLNPKNDLARIKFSEVLWKEGKQDEAIAFLEKSIMRNPSSGKLHSELGFLRYYQGKRDDALAEYTRAIQLDPFLPEPYIEKGGILLSRGLPDAAIPLLETAVSLVEDASAYNVLGAAYAAKGDYSRALAQFRAAYKIQPGFPGVVQNIANALVDLKNYEEAEKFCSKNSRLGMPCSSETLKRIPGK